MKNQRLKLNLLNHIIEKLKLRNTHIYDNDYQSHIIDTNYIVCRAFKKLPEILKISRETIKNHIKLSLCLERVHRMR